MTLNNLKIAFRKLKREKLYSAINIAGLSVALASCIMIFLFVQDEMKYDTFHDNSERIYRLLACNEDQTVRGAIHPMPLLPAISNELPEVKKAARMILFYKNKVINTRENQYLTDLIYADSTFFDLFSFNLVKGNPDKALDDPMSAVLTKSTAQKMFGNENPIGKVIHLENQHNFTITGIMNDFPEHSHFKSDIVISMPSLENVNHGISKSWRASNSNIYLLLKPNTNVKRLETKIREARNRVKPGNMREINFMLQPMERIYLHSSDVRWDYIEKGDYNTIRGLSIIALLVLLIACFNYMNLSTANFTKEAQTTAISKTLGAKRKHLFVKFYTESFILSFLAVWIAIIITELSLPLFEHFTGKELSVNFIHNPTLLLSTLGLLILTVLMGGTYPALFLSNFKPLMTIKKMHFFSNPAKTKHGLWRKGFVVVQFTIATVLIIATIVVFQQIELVTEKKLGFNEEQVVIINNPRDEKTHQRYDLFTELISSNPQVVSNGGSFNTPGERINNHADIFEYGNKENKIHAGFNVITPEYFNVLNAHFKAGKNFNDKSHPDSSEIILNEQAVKKLALKNPVGKLVRLGSDDAEPRKIVGVVENIQYASLREKIAPTAYFPDPGSKYNILVKLEKGNTNRALQYLKDKWNSVSSEWPFRYEFLNQKIDNVYKTEIKTIALIKIFTGLAIFLSCLGIFGFAGFSIKRRTKEIGIRKVNGATVLNIISLLNKDFIKWVLIACGLAVPIAYYLMKQWLQNYAYKTTLNWWLFTLAGLLTIAIAVFTISWQSWRAARQNPVNSLRDE
jgi:putative ABC transport system permease protein